MSTFFNKMTEIANGIRSLTGQTGKLTLDNMQNNIQEANEDKAEMITSLKEMGINIENEAPLSDIANLIANNEIGGNGGGNSEIVEACNVQLSCPPSYNLVFNSVENGQIVGNSFYCPMALTPEMATMLGVNLSSTAKNSFLVCGKSTPTTLSSIKTAINGNVEFYKGTSGAQPGNSCGLIFKIKGDCTITITE